VLFVHCPPLTCADDLDRLPGDVRACVLRHLTNLSRTVESLRAAGVPEAMVERSVDTLVASYRDELTAALGTLAWERAHD
jgi:hypothetical protein